MRMSFCYLAVSALTLAACSSGPSEGSVTKPGPTPTASAPAPTATGTPVDIPDASAPFTLQSVAEFDNPFAVAFLPDGRALVTEKPGKVKLLRPGEQLADVAGVPAVDYGGQGGLLDIAPAPTFADDHGVYLSYSEPGQGGSALALAHATLDESGTAPKLTNLEVLFHQQPPGGGGQFGSIIAFAPDGESLFLSSGERQRKTPAQDPNSAMGKILHMTLDGKPAPDNPYLSAGGERAYIWSSGHRNPYGLTFDRAGNLWEIEMGPQGGDELNLILKGRNYGWPVVSNGDNYDGSPIPDHDTRPEFEAPKLWWNPSISPAGLVIYSGDDFPAWQGSAILGALSGQALVRAALNGKNAQKADQWDMGMRIRDVAQAPDGSLWLLQDGDGGKLMKAVPKQ
ncbi:PQQ-dependent sugar dehydrogenase [Stakelama saccharophila]|uniref:PQQ-dependent sugar dehydrogenase n=1 Tax=Stakelama saccharophila TaxID=3075605 RepID=A0ABZ0B9M0_9SPHN|nr:PQQ-dependent sugar dehydrogenase [Stakelama sp. W311]WNO53912.1 PQQ-dependent sugar dehydrogenase [Stakelama sp. W311]